MQTRSGGQCGKVRYEVKMDIGEVIACTTSSISSAQFAAFSHSRF
jgi:hypothetical protein